MFEGRTAKPLSGGFGLRCRGTHRWTQIRPQMWSLRAGREARLQYEVREAKELCWSAVRRTARGRGRLRCRQYNAHLLTRTLAEDMLTRAVLSGVKSGADTPFVVTLWSPWRARECALQRRRVKPHQATLHLSSLFGTGSWQKSPKWCRAQSQRAWWRTGPPASMCRSQKVTSSSLNLRTPACGQGCR